jgi:hypothetical protein
LAVLSEFDDDGSDEDDFSRAFDGFADELMLSPLGMEKRPFYQTKKVVVNGRICGIPSAATLELAALSKGRDSMDRPKRVYGLCG